MCFYKVDDGKYTDVQVAAEDIKCYKLLLYSDKEQVISPYRYMLYFKKNSKVLSVTKRAKFSEYHEHNIEISEGLHSYSNKKWILKNTIYTDCIYDAIIPKGTRYYYNKNRHEYVAEKLIVYNKIKK